MRGAEQGTDPDVLRLTAEHRRPHVVIVGGGFGGLSAARQFRGAGVDVTLVDRTNHHLFQPLLYQVATATLAPSDIAVPTRWVLRKHRDVTVILAEVTDIDVERHVVYLDEERRALPYDYLIVAAGSRHAYFGHDEWENVAPGLKSLADALEIRRRFLVAYEMAEKSNDPAERQLLQTFVIVGGGPTGVELAGMFPYIAKVAFRNDFRRVDTTRTRVLLVEAGPRILPSFPEGLAARARRDLEDLGVEVRTGHAVTRIDDESVHVGDERIAVANVFWAAGNAASPLGRRLGVETDRVGRVPVGGDLSIPGHPEVFVVGDLAAYTQSDGSPVPGVAPAANQMGTRAGKNVVATLRGQPRKNFRYFDKGNLATIGRHKAIADWGRFRLSGSIAWFFWLFVHIMYLVGFRNRLSVLLSWAYSYFTAQRGVRLITGMERTHSHPREAPSPSAAPIS
jgi:NADH dehydrogenase